uniref:Uncharacterized protein n=1 Tax=Anguilla anguilla TaxID=7936 RepID=A0A0E9WJ66_ANGAN
MVLIQRGKCQGRKGSEEPRSRFTDLIKRCAICPARNILGESALCSQPQSTEHEIFN